MSNDGFYIKYITNETLNFFITFHYIVVYNPYLFMGTDWQTNHIVEVVCSIGCGTWEYTVTMCHILPIVVSPDVFSPSVILFVHMYIV